MARPGVVPIIVLFILGLGSSAVAEGTDDVYGDIGTVSLKENAGLTPDSRLYFIDEMLEGLLVGDDPEKALSYKEEKISEAKLMVEKGDVEAAKKAFAMANKYGGLLEKEVSPAIEKRARESSKAVKETMQEMSGGINGSEWKEVRDLADGQEQIEDNIALAAKISTQIQELCKSLSRLDPVEYARVCKTENDSPEWKIKMDQELTEEQKKEAEAFFNVMANCYKNPKGCECDKITVESFAENCRETAPLAAKCMEGDKEACAAMDEMGDPIDLLPPHLQEAMAAVEERFMEAKFDNHMPKECLDAKATTREACEAVMFKLNAPPECVKAYEEGTLTFSGEKEASQKCDEIMFKENAPAECIEAGLKDQKECEKLMFRLEAPKECLDAGLTGEGRNDWKKCETIRFQLEMPKECLDAGLTGEGKDDWKKCEAIRFRSDAPKECLDAGLTGEGRDDWKKCEAIRFKLDAPQECIAAGLTGEERDDWKKCELIRFKAEMPKECLDAGLTGAGRDDQKKCDAIRFRLDAAKECLDAGLTGEGKDDWKKCDLIQFKANAPQECLDAGLTGAGRDDWKKCDAIRARTQGQGNMQQTPGPQPMPAPQEPMPIQQPTEPMPGPQEPIPQPTGPAPAPQEPMEPAPIGQPQEPIQQAPMEPQPIVQ